jgi:hypothetical protein
MLHSMIVSYYRIHGHWVFDLFCKPSRIACRIAFSDLSLFFRDLATTWLQASITSPLSMPPKPSPAIDPSAKRIITEQRTLALDVPSMPISASPGAPRGRQFTSSVSSRADSATELDEAAAAITSQASVMRKGTGFTLAEAFQRVKPAAVASLLGRSDPNQELGEELERAR